MKKILISVFAAAALLLIPACSDILEEQPRAVLTPDFFTTEEGIEFGLTSVYSQTRWMYGPIGMMYLTTAGTDEATYGDNKDGAGLQLDTYDVTASNGHLGTIWNSAFPAINTCNGIIEKGSEAGVDVALIAEAKFFRGFNYFLLASTYGGVPLDLGSGELKFNTTPSRFSSRNTLEEVYTKAILPDLIAASAELPVTPRVITATNQIAAKHFLAKAYLTYAWWLERNGKTDPDGKTPAQYYQLAYDVSLDVINNPGDFKLQSTFKDVNLASNDYNKEILLCSDHTASDYKYDESTSNSWGANASSNLKSNRSSFAMASDFELSVNGNKFIYRQAVQELGRPWRMLTPTHEVFTKTYPVADRVIDSRFDGTFVTVFRANYQGRAAYNGTVLKGMNGIDIVNNDTVMYFPATDNLLSSLQYPAPPENDLEKKPFGYLSNKAYAIWTPSMVSRHNYPSVWKFGPSRDDQTPDGSLKNDASTRPFPIAKLSETYLIAAEAAVKGATPQANFAARDLVNIIRKRAAMPGRSADMEAATPAVIDVDYILMERSRELYAENHRWYDLTRTGKLEQYAKSYSICETNRVVPKIVSRTIEAKHYLRPIPSGQFDNMDNTEAEKAEYQNEGY